MLTMNNKAMIFGFLYEKSNDSYNINQISRLMGVSVGSAFKILKEFEKLGYVTSRSKNNALLYQIDLNNKTKEVYERLEEEKVRKNKKKTKVMCAIGSVSSNQTMVRKLMENGMDVVRIDASIEKDALKIIKNIREASAEMPILINIPQSLNRQWLKFALKNDLEFVSVAARSAEDIKNVNKVLGYADIKQVIGDKIKVFAMIDKNSLRNYKEIISESYGVIIDRDKLANIKIETLPKLQKEIIDECNKLGKPVVISNILNSMVESKQPSQSDVYDISNAVLDGASCLMLSDGMALDNILESTATLSRIIKNVETENIKISNGLDYDLTHFIGSAVSELEKILRIDALLIITSGGYSARMISSRRLRCKTIAATSRKKIFRQLHILWGIEPLYVEVNTEDISNEDKKDVILKALNKGFIGKRGQIAIIASIFHSKSKRTNLLEIHNVSEFLEYLNKNDAFL